VGTEVVLLPKLRVLRVPTGQIPDRKRYEDTDYHYHQNPHSSRPRKVRRPANENGMSCGGPPGTTAAAAPNGGHTWQ
jgi:hypothetical protein